MFFVFRAGAGFVTAEAHFTPQDRADCPGNNAEDKEGHSHKGVIVSKDFLGEEKSPSRQRQAREKTRNSSNLRNGDIAIDDMRMAAHDPRKHPAGNHRWNETINMGHEQCSHRDADPLGVAMEGGESEDREKKRHGCGSRSDQCEESDGFCACHNFSSRG